MGRIITPTPDWQVKLDSEPLLFNTGFVLWQRGALTSFSPSNTMGRFADEWKYYQAPGITDLAVTIERLSMPGVFERVLLTDAARVTVTTPHPTLQNYSSALIEAFIEGYFGQILYEFPFTVSFWVRSSVPGTYSLTCRMFDNVGTIIKTCSRTYTIDNASTWEKKVVRFPKPPTIVASQRAVANARCFDFLWPLCTGSDNQTPQDGIWLDGDYHSSASQINMTATVGATFDITAVALQLGHQEPVWRPEPFDFTLQRARRYFQKSYDLDTAPGTVTTNGMVRSALTQLPSATRRHAIQVKLSSPMRAAPTVTVYSPSTGAPGKLRDFATLTDLPANVRDVSNAQFHVDALTTVASPDIDFRFHYTAEAPL